MFCEKHNTTTHGKPYCIACRLEYELKQARTELTNAEARAKHAELYNADLLASEEIERVRL